MRIAILASNFIRIPPELPFIPKGYSGAPEKIMSAITEGLVKRGHDVTLFASGDSQTSARLISVTNKSISMDPLIAQHLHDKFEHLLISKCYKMAQNHQFDIIHSTFDILTAYYAQLVAVPTVSTLHSPLGGSVQKILSQLNDTQFYVSISNAQRIPLPHLKYAATIYHGIDVKNFAYSESKNNGYMINVGRIMPEKGITVAINVANMLKKRLYLLGTGVEDSDFWKKDILPYINNNVITQVGLVNKDELNNYYANAKLFLFPIQWDEPFGLVMVESMACGTPVVAFARGSVPEIIEDGVTGFIVNQSDSDIRGNFIIKKTGIEGLKEAVERVYTMPEDMYRKMRRACRAHIEKNFTVEHMIDQYEALYKQILAKK